jgi:hypothetical protein
MFRCPMTDRNFSTGIDAERVRLTPGATIVEHCPYCGQNHAWRPNDAWLAESVPPSEAPRQSAFNARSRASGGETSCARELPLVWAETQHLVVRGESELHCRKSSLAASVTPIMPRCVPKLRHGLYERTGGPVGLKIMRRSQSISMFSVVSASAPSRDTKCSFACAKFGTAARGLPNATRSPLVWPAICHESVPLRDGHRLFPTHSRGPRTCIIARATGPSRCCIRRTGTSS